MQKKISNNIETYYKRVGKTCFKYNMLSHGDKVLIGLSGGKDSLFLVEALVNLKKHLPFSVELIVAHIHVSQIGYLVDKEYITEFCRSHGVDLVFEELSVDLTSDSKKAPCFVCSWHRRKKLFELTRKYGCNKLALGHHLDDAVETLLINMVYHGSISSFPAKLKMFNGRVYLIRPLIEIMGDEMLHIAEVKQYSKLKSECPYNDNTRRTYVRNIIKELRNANPIAGKNIFRAMGNIFPEYLPTGIPENDGN